MTSTTRRLVAGAVVAAGTLLATGCQSHVGTAATVGQHSISTDQLTAAYTRQLAVPAAQQATAAPVQLERRVLGQLITHVLLDKLAADQGISLSQGDIDAELNLLKGQKDASGQSPLAAIPQTDQPRTARDNLLAQRLEISYATGTDQDSLSLGIIVVGDAAKAKLVAARLRADPSAFDQLARTYSTSQQTQLQPTPITQLPTQLKDAKKGDVLIVPQQGSFVVVYVVARSNEQVLLKKLDQVATQLGVHVNPRFGAWNASQLTVAPASNGPVQEVTPTSSPSLVPGGGQQSGAGQG